MGRGGSCPRQVFTNAGGATRFTMAAGAPPAWPRWDPLPQF